MAVLQFPTPTVFRNLDTPTAPSDAVTKAYVDSIATQNAVWTNANDTITFSNVDGSTFDVKLTGFADLDNATLTGNTTITTLYSIQCSRYRIWWYWINKFYRKWCNVWR
jgi:hypothetical protein